MMVGVSLEVNASVIPKYSTPVNEKVSVRVMFSVCDWLNAETCVLESASVTFSVRETGKAADAVWVSVRVTGSVKDCRKA